MTRPRVRFLGPAIGLVGLLALVEAVGRLGLMGDSWPPLSSVVSYAVRPGPRTLIGSALRTTGAEAAAGFLLGVLAAVTAALVAVLVPFLRPGLERLAVVVSSLPFIALAPVLVTTVGIDRTPQVITAIAVSFLVFVPAMAGLTNVPPAQRELFDAYGASRLTRLVRLQIPVALPVIMSGLVIAAPTALLAAVIGEWFGAPQGLGVLLISAMQNFQIPLLWSAALALALASAAVYGLLQALQRALNQRLT